MSYLPTDAPPDGFPVFDDDPFSAANLADSRNYFQILRDLGDAVWVPSTNMFVAARYDDVAAALRAPEILTSGEGVALNTVANERSASTSAITSDGALHSRLKAVEMKPLQPVALRALQKRVQDLASARVSELANGQTFDAMARLAPHLPVTVVTDLVGIRGLTSEQMLRWSNTAFDSFGPLTRAPTQEELDTLGELSAFSAQIDRGGLTESGWAVSGHSEASLPTG